MLIASIHSAHVNLFPLDGNIIGLENSFDRFGNLGTDTITCNPCKNGQRAMLKQLSRLNDCHTWDERYSVLAPKLGRFEDV